MTIDDTLLLVNERRGMYGSYPNDCNTILPVHRKCWLLTAPHIMQPRLANCLRGIPIAVAVSKHISRYIQLSIILI